MQDQKLNIISILSGLLIIGITLGCANVELSESEADNDDPGTDTGTGQDSDPGPDPGNDTDIDGDSDGDTESESESDTDPGTDTDTGADGDTDTDADTDTGADGDTDTDVDGDTDMDGDTDTDVDGDTDSDTDTDTDADTDSDTDTNTPNPCEDLATACPDTSPPTCVDGDLMETQLQNCEPYGETAICTYRDIVTECSYGCSNDACNSDPCADPEAACPDTSPWTCVDNDLVETVLDSCTANGAQPVCNYRDIVTPCSFGCSNDTCNSDPCADPEAACPDTSPPTCVGDTVVETVLVSCVADLDQPVCTYDDIVTNCPYGCHAGECISDPCFYDENGDDISDTIQQPDTNPPVCWRRCPLPSVWNGSACVGSASTYHWTQAEQACDDLGYRLPTAAEYTGPNIADGILSNCVVDNLDWDCNPCASSPDCSAMFSGDTGAYWSSTYRSYYGSDCWYFANFSTGNLNFQDNSNYHRARCVL